MARRSKKNLYLALGAGAVAAAGVFFYKQKKAQAATQTPPLSLPAATAATQATTSIPAVTTAPVPNAGSTSVPDFSDATMAAAIALDTQLLNGGCTTQSDPTVQQFQNAYQADPKGGILFGGADGKYGTSTQTALSQVLGVPAPASCFSN